MIQEFRDFVNRGNFVDIAVAFVIGAAFGTVVSAFTQRIVGPLLAMLFDLRGLERMGTFGPVDESGVPAGSVGAFVEALANFLLVAVVMFLVVRAYNTFKERAARSQEEAGEGEEAPAAPPEDVALLREIRDLLARTR